LHELKLNDLNEKVWRAFVFNIKQTLAVLTPVKLPQQAKGSKFSDSAICRL